MRTIIRHQSPTRLRPSSPSVTVTDDVFWWWVSPFGLIAVLIGSVQVRSELDSDGDEIHRLGLEFRKGYVIDIGTARVQREPLDAMALELRSWTGLAEQQHASAIGSTSARRAGRTLR